MLNKIGIIFCIAYGAPPPPINLQLIKYRMSFLLKNSFNLKNFGANLTFIVSLKKKPTKIYKKVAPKVVDVSTINIPHHFPKTNPENTKSGIAKPKSNTQIMQKMKKLYQ